MNARSKTDELFHAIDVGDATLVKYWIAAGACLSDTNRHKKTPIQQAADMKKWSCVEAILEAGPKTIPENGRYKSALLSVVYADQKNLAIKLLAAGVEPRCRRSSDGNYCLHDAVVNRSVDLIGPLLKQCADIYDEKNNNGERPVDLAVRLGYWDIVVALLNNLEVKKRRTAISELLQCFIKLNNRDDLQRLVNYLSLNYLIYLANEIEQSLRKNTVKAGEIGSQIALLEMLDKAILENTMKSLSVDSQEISPAEANPRQALLVLLQTLINYSGNFFSPEKFQQIQLPEAKAVAEVLSRKKYIESYYERIKGWLDGLERRIRGRQWQIRFLGGWNTGTSRPVHVELICKTLSKLKDMLEPQDVLNIYVEVRQILSTIPPSEKRHKSTTQFYRDTLQGLDGIMFLAPEEFAATVNSLLVTKESSPVAVVKEDARPVQSNLTTTARLYPLLTNVTELVPSAPPFMTNIDHLPAESVPASVPMMPDLLTPVALQQTGQVLDSVFVRTQPQQALTATNNPVETETLVLPEIPHHPLPQRHVPPCPTEEESRMKAYAY